MGLGELPADYSKAVHGPYDPAIFYGKKDTPFGQVKLGELGSWFARRDISPTAAGRAVSRAYWRWNHKYALPKHCGLTPVLQMTAGLVAAFYLINYSNIKHRRNMKYHW